MYKEKCFDCGFVFYNEERGDYCPNCGSGDTDDFHLRECECGDCNYYCGTCKKKDRII